MFRMLGTPFDIPVVSRRLVLGVVLLAVLLSAVGLAVAVRQSESLAKGRIADLRPDAGRQIAKVQQEFVAALEHELRRLVRDGCAPQDDRTHPPWIVGACFRDDSTLRWCPNSKQPSLSRIVELLLQNRLDKSEEIRFLHATASDPPLLVAYRVLPPNGGAVAAAVVVDPEKLRREFVEPRITGDGRLALADAADTADTWHESLGSALPFWSVRPSADFVARQRSAGKRQTLLYAGVTVLALAALLLAVRAMNRLVQQEIALSRMKSRFVADVSHELKTPLALIRMFGETLLEGRVASPEKAQEYYRIITRESTRLTHLIENILDFSRIDAGRKQYRMEPLDVGSVVRATFESYRHELEQQGFEHRCAVADGLPPICGDADAIGQVLVNLMSNALKYSTEDKYLLIEVRPETRRGKHGVLIAVRDRGIGIRPEDREHLFDGFFRADDDRVRRRRGAGLGLALCKRIVEAHRGYIDVESRLVKGSEFRVFLPQEPYPQEPL